MKSVQLTGTLLVAGLLLGGGTAVTLNTTGTPGVVTAQAATTPATSGTLEDSTWSFADGTLTIGGTLANDPTSQSSAYQAVITQLAAAGQTVERVSFAPGAQAPANSYYLLAQLTGVREFTNLANLDVSHVTSMNGFFSTNASLETVDISGWDTHQVTDMQAMFNSDSALTQVTLGNIDTSHVTNMMTMFAQDTHLTSLDLSGLDTHNVTNNFMMLYNDRRLADLNLGNWSGNAFSSGVLSYSSSYSIQRLTLGPQTVLGSGTFKDLTPQYYENFNTTDFTGKWQNVADQYQAVGTTGKRVYTTSELISLYDGTHTADLAGNQTYTWEPVVTPEKPAGAAVTVHYVDQDGQTLQADTTLNGKVDADWTIDAPTIAGYTLAKTTGVTSGTFTAAAQTVTFTYQRDQESSSSSSSDSSSGSNSNSSNSSSSTGTSSSSMTSTGPSVSADNGGTAGSNGSSTPDSSADLVTDGDAATIAPAKLPAYVTAVKKVGLYRTPTLTAKQRITWYAKQAKPKQPTFKVLKQSASKNGRVRYYVKDVNRRSATFGKRGYLTAQPAYVRATYAQSQPRTIRVATKGGLNSYRTKGLTHRVHHYRKGQKLTVKKLVTVKQTTRYQLTNGRYVSANRQFTNVIK